jgi:hypothetical protein
VEDERLKMNEIEFLDEIFAELLDEYEECLLTLEFKNTYIQEARIF